jgi:hypothetical protein
MAMYMQAPTQTCLTCGKTFAQGYSTHYDTEPPRVIWEENTICEDCEQLALFGRLSVEQQQQVDEAIFSIAILQGITLLRKSLQLGLKESLFLYSWRYGKLKEVYPHKMARSDSAYWAGFYS